MLLSVVLPLQDGMQRHVPATLACGCRHVCIKWIFMAWFKASMSACCRRRQYEECQQSLLEAQQQQDATSSELKQVPSCYFLFPSWRLTSTL